jgi:hypothetical protein
LGNIKYHFGESQYNDSYLNGEELYKESKQLATVRTEAEERAKSGIKPPAHGFSVPYSVCKCLFLKTVTSRKSSVFDSQK